MALAILFLLGTLLLVKAEILTSRLPPRPPTCGENCLVAYAKSAHRADCPNQDSTCICHDPLFGPFVACCIASCSSSEIDITDTYLRYACAQAAVDLPDLTDCNAAKKNAVSGVQSLDVTFVDGSGSIIGEVGGTKTVETEATTTVGAPSTTSRSSLPASTSATTTSPTAPESSRNLVTTVNSGLLSISSSSSIVVTTVGSSTMPSSTENSKVDHGGVTNTSLTLGLSLGFGIPLTVAAVGLISFLFYRHRKTSLRDSTFADIGTWNAGGQATYPTEWKPEMAGCAADRYNTRGQGHYGGPGVELGR